jgi:hypothetical protein
LIPIQTALVFLQTSGISKLKLKSFFKLNVIGVKTLLLFLLLVLAGSARADDVERPWATPGFGLKTSNQIRIDQLMRDAELAWKSEDFKKAADDYLVVIKLDPNNWIAYQNLAGCYFRLHQNHEAKRAYQKSLDIHPDNPDVAKYMDEVIKPVTAPGPTIGQLTLGVTGDVWDSNYSPATNGWEVLFPMSGFVSLWKDTAIYAKSEFANGNYVFQGGAPLNLTAFSDTTVGGEIGFKTLDLNSVINISFNIPTGNSAWESQTAAANIPEEFVDDRYQGRGFGASGLYGVSIPMDKSHVGVAAGYIYSGDYNPYFGLSVPAQDLKLGDSVFLSLNRVTPMSANESEVIQASGFYFLPTQVAGQNFLWTGPNINLSYGWANPTAFSFELGAQVYLPGQTAVGGQWVADTSYSYGPRFYLNPSYVFGDFALTSRIKYVLANGYGSNSTDPLHSYDGGGLLLGIEPSYKIKLDESGMAIKIWASYDNINAFGGGRDSQGNLVNVLYDLWTLGTNYAIPF